MAGSPQRSHPALCPQPKMISIMVNPTLPSTKAPGDEHLIVKKGFGGFSNTPLDTILRNLGVTTCVVAGVTTCVCVSNTVRGRSSAITA